MASRENGRITLLWCAFDGAPNVVRLHGHGRVVRPDDPEYAEWSGHFHRPGRLAGA